jgi:hypothetical protein
MMPRKPEGDRALTPAERQARQREREAVRTETWRRALERIQTARTVRDAREIAAEALS